MIGYKTLGKRNKMDLSSRPQRDIVSRNCRYKRTSNSSNMLSCVFNDFIVGIPVASGDPFIFFAPTFVVCILYGSFLRTSVTLSTWIFTASLILAYIIPEVRRDEYTHTRSLVYASKISIISHVVEISILSRSRTLVSWIEMRSSVFNKAAIRNWCQLSSRCNGGLFNCCTYTCKCKRSCTYRAIFIPSKLNRRFTVLAIALYNVVSLKKRWDSILIGEFSFNRFFFQRSFVVSGVQQGEKTGTLARLPSGLD